MALSCRNQGKVLTRSSLLPGSRDYCRWWGRQFLFMKIIEKRLDDLQPYENNPRHNEAAVQYVANSLHAFGWKQPIVIDKDGVIVAGHTRVLAAKSLGWDKAPCVVADDLTPEQVKAYRLADNKTAEIAEWDFEALEFELTDLEDEFDMSEFGFLDEAEEADDTEAEDDDFDPEPPEEAKTKKGDLYQLGSHRLLCGDSTSAEDVQVLVGGRQMDLLLTDPPYNVALGMGGSVDEARKRHRRTDGLVIMNDKQEDSAFRNFLTTCFSNAFAVMKPGAPFYIWHADNESYNFRGALRDAGQELRQTLIWVKNSMTLGRQDYQWRHEPCLYGWKEGAGHNWYSDRKQTTVLEYDRPTKSELHPTMKPIPLFDYQIQNSSKKGDAVLDLFGGSGTTLICCEQDGRDAYLMELDPRYCDVIISRWETMTGEKAVLVNAEGENHDS